MNEGDVTGTFYLPSIFKELLKLSGAFETPAQIWNVTFAATSSHFWDIYFTFLKVKALKDITDVGIEVYHNIL